MNTNLITALEANLFSWIPLFGRFGQMHVNDPPGVRRSITPFPLPLFNSIMDARLAPEQVGAAVARVIADARAQRVPALWWISPSTRPADLGKRLEEHGFSFREEMRGMALDLDRLNELPPPEGLSIQRAQDSAAWQIWTQVMALGFEIPASRAGLVANAWYEFLSRTDPETVPAYTGYWNGKPVATSLLTFGGGVAGIYSVATLPEARRRGIGAQITLHPLLQAQRLGYTVAVLAASEMGTGVYRGLGFRECCTIRSYIWREEVK